MMPLVKVLAVRISQGERYAAHYRQSAGREPALRRYFLDRQYGEMATVHYWRCRLAALTGGRKP